MIDYTEMATIPELKIKPIRKVKVTSDDKDFENGEYWLVFESEAEGLVLLPPLEKGEVPCLQVVWKCSKNNWYITSYGPGTYINLTKKHIRSKK